MRPLSVLETPEHIVRSPAVTSETHHTSSPSSDRRVMDVMSWSQSRFAPCCTTPDLSFTGKMESPRHCSPTARPFNVRPSIHLPTWFEPRGHWKHGTQVEMCKTAVQGTSYASDETKDLASTHHSLDGLWGYNSNLPKGQQQLLTMQVPGLSTTLGVPTTADIPEPHALDTAPWSMGYSPQRDSIA